MRRLFALGLTICVAGSAAAQTEVIIRRPGERDQVIRLDSAHAREALSRAKVELERATTEIHERMSEMQGKLGEIRLKEMPSRTNTLALRNTEIAAEKMIAPMMRRFATGMRQPHLGVVVATQPRETDKYGAYIQAVTPGSPAEKAGIVSGDIIVRIAGKSLTDKSDKDDSGPGLRLISVIGTLTVGKPVDVELRRGTQNKVVKVTPNDDESGAIARSIAPSMVGTPRITTLDRAPGAMAFGGDLPGRALTAPASPSYSIFSPGNGTFSYSFGSNGLFAAYELAPLNEKLGAYFGTSEGVLVVNTNAARGFFSEGTPMSREVATGRMLADSVRVTARAGAGARMSRDSATLARIDSTVRGTARGGRVDGTVTYIDGVPMQPGFYGRKAVNIGLEPGDVIVSVDGRKVTNPGQLMRIVGTYEHNDEFKLQIMRQKRAETLTVKMP